MTATERLDIALESSLPATIESITIPPGKDRLTATVVFQRAGIAKLKATSGKLSPGYGVISVTQQEAADRQPAPGFGLRLASFREPAPPRAGLQARAEGAGVARRPAEPRVDDDGAGGGAQRTAGRCAA